MNLEDEPTEQTGGGIVEVTNDPTTLRMLIDEMVKAIRGKDGRPQSREMSLAVTKLQEAGFWITQHLIQS